MAATESTPKSFQAPELSSPSRLSRARNSAYCSIVSSGTTCDEAAEALPSVVAPFAKGSSNLCGASGLGSSRVATAVFVGTPAEPVSLTKVAGGCLDARGAESLRAVLRERREAGAAILFVSEDLDELFAVSDRLIVLHDGQVAGTFAPDQFSAETVGPVMVGTLDAA